MPPHRWTRDANNLGQEVVLDEDLSAEEIPALVLIALPLLGRAPITLVILESNLTLQVLHISHGESR